MPKQKTRADLEQVIIQGGSVRYKGRIIKRVQDLPSDAELAGGDPQREATALADIDAQIARLQNERTRLIKPAPAPESTHPFAELLGVTVAEKLIAAGYDTPEKVAATTDEQLLALDGIGQKTVDKLREAYGVAA